ncbi:hypothetical protein ANOM_004608 [Aspergillus nomiae NRRL 13137]|uniref:15-cis-phytoene synthase n=1 Tax=Aspergillus nomiae NRRL (strain ATCC 15546 / NRRL 13137 / CBS 260.88 / M93) TaxID=1509407 RepID=A0A0L1J7J8_ASPN3|nr:uncharacterized protein ANOM_004608 [Aspergillus nomiae NRRL 13137]KNG87786.1 hypothetical protein ANOM_004608 [Aspergillus nomiae NRRL 13137]
MLKCILYYREVVFFAITNALVVFGLVTCDVALAIDQYDYLTSGTSSTKGTSLKSAFTTVTVRRVEFNNQILDALCEATNCLHLKSPSMYLGSALFEGQLRIDLIFLYSFCRLIDDLVDEAQNKDQAFLWIERCSALLDARFLSQDVEKSISLKGLCSEVDQRLVAAIKQIPAPRLSKQPLLDLLRGLKTDLEFNHKQGIFPIQTEADLDMYASLVAGTVGELTLSLIYHHHFQNKPIHPPDHLQQITAAGREMGRALQYVNIARDIHRDAVIGRVYIPTAWLQKAGVSPLDVIDYPSHPKVYTMQAMLLDKAEYCYQNSRAAIDKLPLEIQGPVNATIESYMEISRSLRKKKGNLQSARKFRLPLWRRLLVAWKAMNL